MFHNKKLIKELLIAFSFANLFLLAEWLNFLGSSKFSMGKYELANLTPSSYPAMFAALLIAGSIYFILLRIGERAQTSLVRSIIGLLLTASLILPLNALRLELPNPESFSPYGLNKYISSLSFAKLYSVAGTLFIIFCFLLYRWLRSPKPVLIQLGRHIAYICIPILFITCGNLLWIWTSATNKEIPQTETRSKQSNRVVWIIFDEWDQRLSFRERPNTLQLPHFEAIKNSSLSFENSYPPGRNTIESIPSLLIGRKTLVERFESDDLLLLNPNKANTHWSEEANIFSFAKQNGNSTAIAGWFHRYCEVFKKDLDICHRNSRLRFDYSTQFIKNIEVILTRTFNFRHRNTKIHIDDYTSLLDKTKLLASNADLDLVFVHLPVPHGPFIFDRTSNKLNPAKVQNAMGYLDNLALADAAMGEIRQAMEANGTWEKTTLILSADHSWRDSKYYDGKHDYRVPFIIKMPDSKQKVKTQEYSTILSFNLVKEVLQGKINNTDQADVFFDKHSKDFRPNMIPSSDPILSGFHTH